MPLAFLVPAFLAGLAALAVPVLLHLRRRDRHKPVPFPSLMFLARIPIQTQQRRRITDWPLLLLRALAILLLVGAFARPFLKTGGAADAGAAGLTVLLLDRSASMSAAGIDDAWRDSAEAVLVGLPSGRRIAVVAFDTEADVLAPPTADLAAARAAIGTAPAAAGGTRFGAGLRAAAGLLAGERVPGEIVLVSDLQRTGRVTSSAPALPAGTAVRTIVVTPRERENAAVVGIEVEPVAGGELRRAVVAARLTRHGGEVPAPRDVRLLVDGREAATRAVSLPADGGARVVFDSVTLARGAARLEVELPADGFAADDRFVAVVPGAEPSRLLLVVPRDVQADEVRYLERALAIGTDPAFAVERTTRLDRAAISRSAAVILYDVAMPSVDDASGLGEWLAAGGGVVVVAGRRLAGDRDAAPALAAAMRGAQDRRDAGIVGAVVTTHPALVALRESGAAGLGQVRIRRHARLDAAPGATPLAMFDDGSPAVLAAAVGTGRALLVAIPLDARDGDFPLQPTFLPFVRGVATWAAGAQGAALAMPAGEPWAVPAGVVSPVLRGPAGELVRPERGQRLVVPRMSGFHELHDGRPDGVPLSVLAVNVPVGESDLAAMPAAELLLGVAEADPNVAMSGPEPVAAREARQRGWRWLLLALLLILGVEVLVASRGWRGIASRSPLTIDSTGDTA
jgi:hypothetical protein